MITVELKRGFGYLGAGSTSKKIEKNLVNAGVEATCYADDGYAKIDVQGIKQSVLAVYISNVVKEKLAGTGVIATCGAEGNYVKIDIQGITLDVLEEKIKEKIRAKTNGNCWVEAVY